MIPKSEYGKPLESTAIHRFGLIVDRSDDAVREYAALAYMVDPNTVLHHVKPDDAAKFTGFRNYDFVLVENGGFFKGDFPGLNVVERIRDVVTPRRIIYASGYPDSSLLKAELDSRGVRHWQRGQWTVLKGWLEELLLTEEPVDINNNDRPVRVFPLHPASSIANYNWIK